MAHAKRAEPLTDSPSDEPAVGWLRPFTGPYRRPILLVVLLLVFLPTVTTGSELVNDTISSSVAAWNLAEHGTLDLSASGFEELPWGVEGRNGGQYSNRFPGSFLPAVPLYLLLPTDDAVPQDTSTIPTWPGSATAALLAACALVLLHEVLRDEFGAARAFGATLTAGLATSVWSVAADGLWTHSSGILVLAFVMRALQRQQPWLAGLGFAAAITIRPTHAFTALGVGLALGILHRSWRPVVAVGVPSALGALALAVYTRMLFGTWLPVAGYDTKRVSSILGADEALTGPFTWYEQILGTLFDPYHGVLVYSPFLALCLLFLLPGVRRSPLWARAATVGGLVYWAMQLRGNPWPGGYNFFGYRFPIEPLWMSVVPLAHAWFSWTDRHALVRRIGLVLLTIAFAVTAIGSVMFGARYEPNRPGYERVGPAFTDE